MPFPADSMARAYLAEAAYADDYLGRVIDALDRLELSERTLVVVVAITARSSITRTRRRRGAASADAASSGWAGYDERCGCPGLPHAGDDSADDDREQVSLVDVEPTIRELLGVAPHDEARGRSLAPGWRGQTLPSGRHSPKDRTCAWCAPAAGRTCGAATGG